MVLAARRRRGRGRGRGKKEEEDGGSEEERVARACAFWGVRRRPLDFFFDLYLV